MPRTVTAADLFCGAGGTSTGLLDACTSAGLKLDLTAVNHWDRAIETHSKNHPDARHLCESLDNLNPLRVIPGGRLDILAASPECTHHSDARGDLPMDDQSRASAFHVLRWMDMTRPTYLLLENVRAFLKWGPLDRNKRPIKSKEGAMFQQLVGMIRAMGYRVEWRVLNSADYGAATTRERVFLIARLGNGPIPWPEPTHAQGGHASLFGQVAPWRSARDHVIDWSIPGKSIFGRPKPLADNTLRRIAVGAKKFWNVDLQPFLVVLRNNADARSLDRPLPTITAGGNHVGLVQPFLLGQHSGGVARGVSDPAPTFATKGAISLIEPFLIKYYGTANARPISEPLDTVTTRDRFALVEPAYLDIRLRMLTPGEGAAAMGFPKGYQFAGNAEEQKRQIGNAVEVNQARALFSEMVAASARRAA